MSEFQPAYQKRLAAAIVKKKGRVPFGRGLIGVFRNAFRQLFRRHIVIEYPHVKYDLPPRARYAVRLKLDEQGNHKCTACLICQNTCPDYILRIDVETTEDRSKFIKRFAYQQGGCMMCGLCVEACPFDAIRMSHEYELAHAGADGLSIDLLTNVPAASRQSRQRTESARDSNADDVRGPGPVQTQAEAAHEMSDEAGSPESIDGSTGRIAAIRIEGEVD